MIPHHVMQSIEWAVNLWDSYSCTVVGNDERDRGNGWTHGTLTLTEKQRFENPFPRRREFQISWNESSLVEFEAGDDCWTDIDFLPLYLLLKADEKAKADAVTIGALEVERARLRTQLDAETRRADSAQAGLEACHRTLLSDNEASRAAMMRDINAREILNKEIAKLVGQVERVNAGIKATAARFRILAKENRELRRSYLASEIAGRGGDEHKYAARAELYDREAEALEKLLLETPDKPAETRES